MAFEAVKRSSLQLRASGARMSSTRCLRTVVFPVIKADPIYVPCGRNMVAAHSMRPDWVSAAGTPTLS